MSDESELAIQEDLNNSKLSEEDNSTKVADKEESDFKYNVCKYCRGIIPRSYKRTPTSHCSKICFETNKVVPSEFYFPETGKTEIRGTFSSEKDYCYYREVLKDKAALASAFTQITQNVNGLETGMKLECLDLNNPVNYCVATIIKISGHRICLRYDGFGRDSKNDFWCNFQAEELFPIGWCARKGYHLQPPSGITCSHTDWKDFLSRTLNGALAAPHDLFRKPEVRRQLRCHTYLPGNKVEAIHPKRPDLIVPAVVTKSLGPYYFLVTTDNLPTVPSATFYGYADCPAIYPSGWCKSKGLELEIPTSSSTKEIRMIRKSECAADNSSHGSGKRNRANTFKIAQKIEALHNDVVSVATVAEIFGRVALIVFDGINKLKFIDKASLDVYPVGWSEKTRSVLYTPYGPVDFTSNSPVIGIKPKKSTTEVHSASFSYFKQTFVSSPVKDDKSSSMVQPSSQDQTGEIVDPMDVDMEGPSSPLSPINPSGQEAKKSDIDKFIVWLLNKYEFTLDGNCSIVKPDLVEAYSSLSSSRLSPRWFTLLYKLFPGVVTIRRNIDGRFVNCLKHLKESRHEKNGGPIYVKDAVEYLNSEKFSVQLGTDKLVTYIGLGDKYVIPKDTHEIYTTSKAAERTNVFVIACEVSTEDYTLSNFRFHFEQTPCLPPLPNIGTIEEFRAAFKLCKQATLCNGIDYHPASYIRQGSKVFRDGRVYSMACNLVAYPHKGDLCIHCKNLRGKYNTNSQLTPDPINELLDEPSDELDEAGMSKEDEDAQTLELKIYFNKKCYPGIYLNPDKVVQIAPHTQQDKPPQALKYLMERLIEISISKERLSEILEAGFGTRIFNKSKDKVVKKGLFRFNTRAKVLRFIKRLVKRLSCCESFLTLEPMECQHNCRVTSDKMTRKRLVFGAVPTLLMGDSSKKKKGESNEMLLETKTMSVMSPNHRVTSPVAVQPNVPSSIHLPSPMHHQVGHIGNKGNPGHIINTGQNNLQLLYPIPPGTPTNAHGTPTNPQYSGNSPHLVLHSQDGSKKIHHNKFSQGTQFFLPPNNGNVTYMVVPNNKDKIPVSGDQRPLTGNIHPSYQGQHILTSPPPSGVSQMMANVSKTSLVTDIDDPLKSPLNRSKIPVVKATAPNPNQQIWVKRSVVDSSYEQQHPANVMAGTQGKHQVRINADTSSGGVSPYHENIRLSQSTSGKYPQIQSVTSYADPMRTQYESGRPIVQAGEKGQKIHVHKIHHGNARVKYVEFKPTQDRNQQQQQQQQQQQHSYNQTMYYQASSINSSQSQQHLVVHTPGQSPKSPLHSPPALRPPPSGPPRSIALHSPPSLVPSPEVRPRFEFVGSSSGNAGVNNKNMVQATNTMRPLTPSSGHSKVNVTSPHPCATLNIPRVPSTVLSPDQHQQHHQPKNKVLQSPRVHQNQDGSPLEGKPNTVSSSGSTSASTVTVTMTYIPIQTSTNNKFVYVPVNSLQTGQGQPVVLYQNQSLKDSNGKPVILSPQVIQANKSIMVVSKGDLNNKDSTNTFTTVRIQQGIQQPTNIMKNSTIAVHTPSNIKTLRYQFGQNSSGLHQQMDCKPMSPMTPDNDKQRKGHYHNNESHSSERKHGKIDFTEEHSIKQEESEPSSQLSGKLKDEPSDNKDLIQPIGTKRKISPPPNLHSTPHMQSSAANHLDENSTPEIAKSRKRRGRPPAAVKVPPSGSNRGPRSKLTMMQGNPLPPSVSGNPLTLANRVLTEAFYRKQQQAQNRISYLQDPLLKTPGLPNNPELWTADDVYKYLSQTDCAQYAEALKDEEMDGKSFLLLTREALMEFKGFRLGPALKIVGYAASLRAKHRMQSSTSVLTTPVDTQSSNNDNHNINDNNHNYNNSNNHSNGNNIKDNVSNISNNINANNSISVNQSNNNDANIDNSTNCILPSIVSNSLIVSSVDSAKATYTVTNCSDVTMDTVTDAVQLKEILKEQKTTFTELNSNQPTNSCESNQNEVNCSLITHENEATMTENKTGKDTSSNVSSTTVVLRNDPLVINEENSLKRVRTSDPLPVEVLTNVNSNI